jgi:hypothetical protein
MTAPYEEAERRREAAREEYMQKLDARIKARDEQRKKKKKAIA